MSSSAAGTARDPSLESVFDRGGAETPEEADEGVGAPSLGAAARSVNGRGLAAEECDLYHFS